jgi:hypothetical protein
MPGNVLAEIPGQEAAGDIIVVTDRMPDEQAYLFVAVKVVGGLREPGGASSNAECKRSRESATSDHFCPITDRYLPDENRAQTLRP